MRGSAKTRGGEASTRAERRERFWSKTAPDGPWDTVVIGSGMGGMTTAALLSKLGHRVLVLEQHYVPGGFTHMFKRPGYEWDVGVHAVGEVTEHTLTGRLLARLTDGELKWCSLGPVYDEFYYPGDFRIDFPNNPKQFRDNLVAAFPHQETSVDAYLQHARFVAGAMKRYYLARTLPRGLSRVADLTLGRKAQKYLEMRTRDVIQKLTSDGRLRSVFAAQWGYYGSTPSRSSFAIQALVTKHFMHGGYYPEGGAKQIAKTLLGTVARAGGWTRIRANVDRILLEDGRAVGVKMADGEEIRADRVVSAAGILSTVQRLLPETVRGQRWVTEIEQLHPAPCHVCLYLGFKGDIRKAGAGAANKWFYNTWSTEADEWKIDGAGDALPRAPVLYCSFPSLKDPTHDPGPEERHTGEVVTFVPWDTFAEWQDTRWKKRGDDYDALKSALEQSLLDQFLERLPGLKPMVDHVELSTPLSTDNFVRPVAGSIYGIEPTPGRFRNRWLRPRSPIPGLFFSGSEVATVGVIGAMMGGVLAATAVEPMKMLKLLRRV